MLGRNEDRHIQQKPRAKSKASGDALIHTSPVVSGQPHIALSDCIA